jgi:hypothetical protein
MNKYVAAFALVLLLTGVGIGQQGTNRGLSLTGTVVAVRPVCYSDNYPNKCKNYFSVDLLLQFRNSGNTPLIILRPGTFLGEKRIAFLTDVSKPSSEISAKHFIRESRYPSPPHDPLFNFVRELNFPSPQRPSEYYFVILQPEEYYESRETFILETGYKIVTELPRTWRETRREFAIPEYPALRVEFILSLSNRREGTDLLGTAQRKWKKFGELVLDQNGDYHVKSAVIFNPLTE